MNNNTNNNNTNGNIDPFAKQNNSNIDASTTNVTNTLSSTSTLSEQTLEKTTEIDLPLLNKDEGQNAQNVTDNTSAASAELNTFNQEESTINPFASAPLEAPKEEQPLPTEIKPFENAGQTIDGTNSSVSSEESPTNIFDQGNTSSVGTENTVNVENINFFGGTTPQTEKVDSPFPNIPEEKVVEEVPVSSTLTETLTPNKQDELVQMQTTEVNLQNNVSPLPSNGVEPVSQNISPIDEGISSLESSIPTPSASQPKVIESFPNISTPESSIEPSNSQTNNINETVSLDVQPQPTIVNPIQSSDVKENTTEANSTSVPPINQTPSIQPENSNQPNMQNTLESDQKDNLSNPKENLETDAVASTLQSPSPENTELKSKKKKKKTGLIIILILLLAIAGGVYYYINYFSSPKSVVSNIINTTYKSFLSLENASSDFLNFDYKNNKIKTTGNIALTLNISDKEADSESEELYKAFNNLSKITYNYQSVIDLANKEISFSASANESNKEIIGLDTFYQNKKFYLKSDNITSNPYYYEVEDDSFFDEILDNKISNITKEDINYLINQYITYFKNSIKDDYLSKEYGKYTLNENTIIGQKTTFELKEEYITEMEKSIINSFLKDDKSLEIMAKISGDSVDDVKKSLNEELNTSSEDDLMTETNCSNETNCIEIQESIETIEVYTDVLGNFKGFVLKSVTGETEDLRLTGVKKGSVITIKDDTPIDTNDAVYDTSTSTTFDTITIDLDKKEIKISSNSMDCTFALTNKGASLDYKNETNESNVTTSTNFAMTYENVFADNVSKTNTNFNLSYKDSTINVTGELKYDSTSTTTTGIDKFDVTNAKNINLITEEESTAISNNILNSVTGTPFESIISIITNSLVNSLENTNEISSYDYEDEYDFEYDDIN